MSNKQAHRFTGWSGGRAAVDPDPVGTTAGVAARPRLRDAPVKLVFFNPIGTIGGAEMCLLDVLAACGLRSPTGGSG